MDGFLSLSLHDAIALGDIELGLHGKRKERQSEMDEIERLPVLLRILSASWSLSTIPTFNDDAAHETIASSPCRVTFDNLAEKVVVRLEDVAAAFSVSENVDVVACHLAPSICRSVSKLPSFKRKRSGLSGITAPNRVMTTDEDEDEDGDDRRNYRRRVSARSSETKHVAAEDSPEDVVSKTLSDLSALVASALVPIRVDLDGDTETGKGTLSLTLEDSSLSEPVPHSRTSSVRGAMMGNGFGSIVTSLMYFSSVLRHQHVACALCRLTVPQAADLIKTVGANCPTALPSLLRGCVGAFESAGVIGRHHCGIANMAETAIRRIGELSERELARVMTVLQQEELLKNTVVRLAMGKDSLLVICLSLRHLSSGLLGSAAVSSKLFSPRSESSKTCNTQTKRELLVDTLSFLQKEVLAQLTVPDTSKVQGRLSLVLRSYVWLVLRYDIATILDTVDDGVQACAPFISSLKSLLAKFRRDSCRSKAAGRLERPLKLLFSGLALTLARLMHFQKKKEPVFHLVQSTFHECFELRTIDDRLYGLVARVAAAFCRNNTKTFWNILNAVLEEDFYVAVPPMAIDDRLKVGMEKFCAWRHGGGWELCEAFEDGVSWGSPLDPSVLLDAVDCPVDIGNMKNHLTTSCQIGVWTEHDEIPDLVVKSTKCFATNRDMALPIVSTVQLEANAQKIDLRSRSSSPSCGSAEYCFLLQVLYWLAFMDSNGFSAEKFYFAFDVRVLPLEQILQFVRHHANRSKGTKMLNLHLASLLRKHCPELARRHRWWTRGSSHLISSTRRRKLLEHLSKALKKGLTGFSTADHGPTAERVFFNAQAQLPDAALYPHLVSVVATAAGSTPSFCTCSMLYCDPLVILKAPMSAWQSTGHRRILLSSMTVSLDSNEALLLNRRSPSSASPRYADELISSRHVLLARCLVIAVGGCERTNPERTPILCSMTVHFLRRLFAKNPRMVGFLVKQTPSLPDSAIDWLVEFMPEAMVDAQALSCVLGDRGAVTTKLQASAAILRLAIGHGHQDESIAERLVYFTLAQLVASFFLVIGPIGVPVNVLIGDDAGHDVSQTSRRATLRMLKTLVQVRGGCRPRLRYECGHAMHKLASLCKGENLLSGVTGIVLSRRKALLREIFDCVIKAANAMGSGMDL